MGEERKIKTQEIRLPMRRLSMSKKRSAESVLGTLDKLDQSQSDTISRLVAIGIQEGTLQDMIQRLIESFEQSKDSVIDIISFCNERIKAGVNTQAYYDMRILVRKHKESIEEKMKGD